MLAVIVIYPYLRGAWDVLVLIVSFSLIHCYCDIARRSESYVEAYFRKFIFGNFKDSTICASGALIFTESYRARMIMG